jgi:hypothetical protein
MEIVQGALDTIGPWIGSLAPLPLLFIALVRGWLLTPAAAQKVHESQETRIQEMKANQEALVQQMKSNYDARIIEAREREQEWKRRAEDALEIVKTQQQQLDVVTELGETSAKLLEAVHGAKFGYVPEVRKTTHVVRPGREE